MPVNKSQKFHKTRHVRTSYLKSQPAKNAVDNYAARSDGKLICLYKTVERNASRHKDGDEER